MYLGGEDKNVSAGEGSKANKGKCVLRGFGIVTCSQQGKTAPFDKKRWQIHRSGWDEGFRCCRETVGISKEQVGIYLIRCTNEDNYVAQNFRWYWEAIYRPAPYACSYGCRAGSNFAVVYDQFD